MHEKLVDAANRTCLDKRTKGSHVLSSDILDILHQPMLDYSFVVTSDGGRWLILSVNLVHFLQARPRSTTSKSCVSIFAVRSVDVDVHSRRSHPAPAFPNYH